MSKQERKLITLNGISWLRVFSACQALTMPSRCYGVTHKQAKAVILHELGYVPTGKPGSSPTHGPAGFRDLSKNAIDDFAQWLGIEGMSERRNSPGAITNKDTVQLIVKVPARSKIKEAA